jgi:RNA polymerase sigma-70 factor (ECF subfamily)
MVRLPFREPSDLAGGSDQRMTLRGEPVNPPALDDAELVARARSGDGTARARLFQRHGRALAGLLGRLLGSTADAEDALQDTFIVAFERLAQLRDDDAFAGWLTQIAVRQAHRSFRRRKLLRVLGLDRGERDARFAQLAAPATSPEVRAELRLLDERLDRLPADQRMAWMLRYVEGYELADVARACGCSLATVKRRVAAAHRQVAHDLEMAEEP